MPEEITSYVTYYIFLGFFFYFSSFLPLSSKINHPLILFFFSCSNINSTIRYSPPALAISSLFPFFFSLNFYLLLLFLNNFLSRLLQYLPLFSLTFYLHTSLFFTFLLFLSNIYTNFWPNPHSLHPYHYSSSPFIYISYFSLLQLSVFSHFYLKFYIFPLQIRKSVILYICGIVSLLTP